MELTFRTLLTLQFASCAFMTGLIWVIQFLHYPMFSQIEQKQFSFFHRTHSRRITWLVLPAMTLELGSAVGLFLLVKGDLLLATNLILLIGIWASTALVSVPLHQRLATEQNRAVIDLLVLTNWPRTVLWTVRLVLLGAYFLLQ